MVGGPGHGHLPNEGVVAQKNGDFGVRTFTLWQSYRGHRGENKRPEGPKCWALPSRIVDFGGINGVMKKAARERGDGSLPGVPYLFSEDQAAKHGVLQGPSPPSVGGGFREDLNPRLRE